MFPNATDYTDKDFDALRLRLITLARSVWPTWTEYQVASFGPVLLEAFAFVGDVVGYYQDAQAGEAFLVTATQRASVLRFARMLGFVVPGAAAATGEVTFTLDAVPANDVTFPAGTVVRTVEVVEPERFQLTADLVILAGANPPTGVAQVKHSTAHQLVTDADGLPNREITLERTPYLDASAVVVAANGAYAQVDDLLESGPTDRHFVVVVDENDRATLAFGDGTNGEAPTGAVVVDYEIGGGVAGNVEAGEVNTLEGSFTDAGGQLVRATVSNAAAMSGGAARMSTAAAKVQIPKSVAAGDRSVTRLDFEAHALAVPGVARALMLTSNEDASIDENAGILFVVPEGGGVPSEALLADVLKMVQVTKPPPLTFQAEALAAPYRTVNVEARVWLDAAEATVRAAVDAALAAHFAIVLPAGSRDANGNDTSGAPNPLIDFGFNGNNEIAWSDLFNAVRDAAGVRKVTPGSFKLNGAEASVGLLAREFPVLGTVTLINAATGLEF